MTEPPDEVEWAPLPDWHDDWLLQGGVEDWERQVAMLRLRAMALEHAVRAHYDVTTADSTQNRAIITASEPSIPPAVLGEIENHYDDVDVRLMREPLMPTLWPPAASAAMLPPAGGTKNGAS